jgi:hemerythrin superfamily protein
MDALDFLKHDHRKLKQLFEQAETVKQGQDKKRIFRQIKKELQAHARIEEGIFYPAIEQHEQLKDIVFQSYQEHKHIKTLLGEVDGLVCDNKPFESKFKILKESVTNRNDEEEGKMFPHVRELLDDETLEELGRHFELAKGKRSDLIDTL